MDDKDELLRMAWIALETIGQNIGLPAFIDAAAGSGMSHFGYTCWVKSVRESLKLPEQAIVQNGEIKLAAERQR